MFVRNEAEIATLRTWGWYVLGQACDWTAESTKEEESKSKSWGEGKGPPCHHSNAHSPRPRGRVQPLASGGQRQHMLDPGSSLPQVTLQGLQGPACQQLDLITSLQSEVTHLVEQQADFSLQLFLEDFHSST